MSTFYEEVHNQYLVIYIIYIYYIYYIIYIIYMVLITEGFLEVAIEYWPEWDLNPEPLNFVVCMYVYIYVYNKFVTS